MKIKIEAATRIQAADADAAASAFEAYLATLKPKVKWDTKGYLRSGGQVLTPPEALKVLKGYFPGLVKGEKNKQSLTELTVNGKKVAMYSASGGDVFVLKTPKAVKASHQVVAADPKWMRQMGTSLGNLPGFGPKFADSLIRAKSDGLEIDEDKADKMIHGFKTTGYKIRNLSKTEVLIEGRGGYYGIKVTYGKGEDARVAFYDEQDDDDEED